MAIYSYKIGVGYNLPDGSLTNVEDLHAPGDWRNFYPPNAQTAFNPGTPRIRLDSYRYFTGFNSILWNFDLLTREQYYYLKSTYCIAGGYSGTVTIESVDPNGTLQRYNAVMQLPTPNELQRNFVENQKVQIQFMRLSQIS
jgi:hypothetical protein